MKHKKEKNVIGKDYCTGLDYKQEPRINWQLYAKILEARQVIMQNKVNMLLKV